MYILAIDTSTRFLRVAAAKEHKILASHTDDGKANHSEQLIPVIDEVLKKARIRLKDIDAIALSIGPGSFTGLRIGVASVKAISMALGTKIVAISTLDAIAHNFTDSKEHVLCPVIDAKKQKVYSAFYVNRLISIGGSSLDKLGTNAQRNQGHSEGGYLARTGEYMLCGIESLLEHVSEPTLLFGDGIAVYEREILKNPFARISKKDWHPKVEVVAELGLRKAHRKKFENPDKLVPTYMHSQYCQVRGK
ncbi:MAG: tRNA (adenosine(37)-N6)-threonylcarbamoyltransferase complex dimerization subunit type 1 TsaB [Candidatus Omnitrophica bacterium]|nr:tRNA (adenosine(37)-N6)-threonylcarbamoyltransferase complex dimerization subunit type 1 TsaB [Candidatus Omnitrophota bacterium]